MWSTPVNFIQKEKKKNSADTLIAISNDIFLSNNYESTDCSVIHYYNSLPQDVLLKKIILAFLSLLSSQEFFLLLGWKISP